MSMITPNRQALASVLTHVDQVISWAAGDVPFSSKSLNPMRYHLNVAATELESLSQRMKFVPGGRDAVSALDLIVDRTRATAAIATGARPNSDVATALAADRLTLARLGAELLGM